MSGSVRALSRSRVRPSKTLVPFLYQTATIQQWKPGAQAPSRGIGSSRSRPKDDIPFEDESRSPSIDEAQHSRKTTITGSERLAFEKLYKKFRPPGPRPHGRLADEDDQVIDKYYDDDDVDVNDPAAASLDTLFDSVLSGNTDLQKPQHFSAESRTPSNKEDDLASLAEEILKPELAAARNKKKAQAEQEKERIKKLQEEEKRRMRVLLEAAHTDRELWEVLEREVFSVIRGMDLDSKKGGKGTKGGLDVGKKGKGKGAPKGDMSSQGLPVSSELDSIAPRFPTSATDTPDKPAKQDNAIHDPRIVFPLYPTHLIHAASILRTNFPSSPLPLSLIPTIKSLGRSSYALGASTGLYRTLLRTAWVQSSSYSLIDSLLQDMDNGGIECNYSILNLLDEIIMEYNLARSGTLGHNMQVVMGMGEYAEGIRRIKGWRDILAKRLGAWTEKRSIEGRIVRKYVEGEKTGSVKGPTDELVIRKVEGEKETGAESEMKDPFLEDGGMNSKLRIHGNGTKEIPEA